MPIFGASTRAVRTRIRRAALCAAVAALAAGCKPTNKFAAPPPPKLVVATPVQEKITRYVYSTGNTAPVAQVDLVARVAGFLQDINYRDGVKVKKGDVLFTIDQRPYQAEFKRAQAGLAQARTQLALSKSERERAVKRLDQHAISREEFDSRVAGNEQAEANVEAAAAALDQAALNASFTQVRSPIDGLVSREEVTEGNLVTAGQTLLTTVVSVDKIYVEFEGDEQVYLKYAAATRAGERGNARDTKLPVWVGLADEKGTPHEGQMVFLDNALDAQTGTIRARALLDNKDRRFTPGLLARVKLEGSAKYDAVLVNDSAIGTDQNVRYVFAVGQDNKVEYRAVKLGPVIDDGLRVVRDGLKPGELVVVNGLQRVRPGVTIAPQKIAMGKTSLATGTLAYNK